MPSIYCITSLNGSFTYIYPAEDFTAAVSVHLKLLSAGKHPKPDVQAVYDELGGDFLLFSEISKVTEENKTVKELAYRAVFCNSN